MKFDVLGDTLMDIYKILMFINCNTIHVFEAIDSSTLKRIGFKGNEYFGYIQKEDIDDFLEGLTDHYNIDNLQDLNLHIQIIDCCVAKSIKALLLDKLSVCEQLNVNHVENVIPTILTQKNIHGESQNICVSFWDNKYSYVISDNCYSISDNRAKECEKVSLAFNDFLVLFFWHIYDNHEYDEKLDKINSLLQEKENEINQLTLKNNSLMHSASELESVKKELNELKAYKKNQDLIARRTVVFAKSLPPNVIDEIFPLESRKSALARFSFINSNNTYRPSLIIVEEVKDGDFVSNGLEIAWVKETQRRKTKTSYLVKAPCAGKIAWLYPSEEKIPLKPNHYPSDAVIGDEKDDVEAMRKWYYDNF